MSAQTLNTPLLKQVKKSPISQNRPDNRAIKRK